MSDHVDAGSVAVRLLGVPVALCRQAAQRQEDLRRHFGRLVLLDPDETSVPVRVLRLIDGVTIEYGEAAAEAAEALAAAVARDDDDVDISFRLPAASRLGTLQLAALLEEADAFCQAGELRLALAATPLVLALRRWALAEVVAQIDGAQPTPWSHSAFRAAAATMEEAGADWARSRVDEVAETFADVARLLAAAPSLQATLDRIVVLAVATIDGCDHAGVTVAEGRNMRTAAATDDLPGRVDAIQYETGEGPCVDAIREHEVFQTGDLSAEARWPAFAPRAIDTGVASMVAFRLFLDDDTLGALNFYSRRKEAFDSQDRAVGSIFAAHAAVAFAAAKDQHLLQLALDSRDLIGQAKGILMAHQQISADEAFDVLRRASQRLNLKLRDVARQVAEDPAPQASEFFADADPVVVGPEGDEHAQPEVENATTAEDNVVGDVAKDSGTPDGPNTAGSEPAAQGE